MCNYDDAGTHVQDSRCAPCARRTQSEKVWADDAKDMASIANLPGGDLQSTQNVTGNGGEFTNSVSAHANEEQILSLFN